MRTSRSTAYALLAMAYIAKRPNEKIILSQDISKEYTIPLEYLLKILQQLVRANILMSKRGPHGGFSLATPIKKVSMLQVIEAVEGPLASQLNLEEHSKEKFCDKIENAYKRSIEDARASFDKIKLSNIID